MLDSLRRQLHNFEIIRTASTPKKPPKEPDVPSETPLIVKPVPLDDELKFLDSPSPQPPISSTKYSIAQYVQDRRLAMYRARKEQILKNAELKLNKSLAQADIIIQRLSPDNLTRSKSDGQTLLSKNYVQRQNDKLRASNISTLQSALENS